MKKYKYLVEFKPINGKEWLLESSHTLIETALNKVDINLVFTKDVRIIETKTNKAFYINKVELLSE